MSGYQGGGYQYANVPNAEQPPSFSTNDPANTAYPPSTNNSNGGGGGGGSGPMPTYHEYMNAYNQYANNGGITTTTREDFMERSKGNRLKIAMVLALFLIMVISRPIEVRRDDTPSSTTPDLDPSSSSTAANTSTKGGPSKGVPGDDHSFFDDGGGGGTDINPSSKNTDSMPPQPKSGQGDIPVEKKFNLVYLLTYPMSGTTITRNMFSDVTKEITATNYETDAERDSNQLASIVGDSHEEGFKTNYPFWHHGIGPSNSAGTEKPILTMTHCCGYCMYPCRLHEFVTTHEVFEEHCRMITDSTHEASEFVSLGITPRSNIKKVVHLVRDPISNVVSRFHYDSKYELTQDFHKSKSGFLKWCDLIDSDKELTLELETSNLISQEVKEAMKEVPCKSEFYKYVTWHNHVKTMIWERNYAALTVHYESYQTQEGREKATKEMTDFMEVSMDGNAVPDFTSRSYMEYFTAEQKEKLRVMVQTLAFSETWKVLERYFV